MKKTALLFGIIGLTMTVMFMDSCKKDSNSDTKQMTLYDSLGGSVMVSDPANPSTMIEKGRLGIRSVVDSTIFVIAADTAINGFFQVLLSEVTAGNTSGFEALSKNLTDFFCVATGSTDFTYGGKSMVAAHDPAQNSRINGKVADDDFDAFVADLVVGAHENGLPDYLIARVGALVETQRSAVVQQ